MQLRIEGGGAVGDKQKTSIAWYNKAFHLKPQHVQLVGLKNPELNRGLVLLLHVIRIKNGAVYSLARVECCRSNLFQSNQKTSNR